MISLTIAGRYETQEIVFRTEPTAAVGTPVNGAAGFGGAGTSLSSSSLSSASLGGAPIGGPVSSSSSVTDLLAQVASTGVSGGVNGLVTPLSQGSSSDSVLLPTDVIGSSFQQPQPPLHQQPPVAGSFRSPNVVAPGSQPIPYLQQQLQQQQTQQRPFLGTGQVVGNHGFAPAVASGHPAGAGGVVVVGGARAQPVYGGPYPFASMTHAAQSMLGQTGTTGPSMAGPAGQPLPPPSPTVVPQQHIRAGRPVMATAATHAIGQPAGGGVGPPSPPTLASSSSSFSSSSSPHLLLSSALHPNVTVKSAESVTPNVVYQTPSSLPSSSSSSTMQTGIATHPRPSVQHIQSNQHPHPHHPHHQQQHQQTSLTGPVVSTAVASPTIPGPAALVAGAPRTVQQQVASGVTTVAATGTPVANLQPVNTTVSSPLLVNLLQQQQLQQQQQQQLLSRNNVSNSGPAAVAVSNNSAGTSTVAAGSASGGTADALSSAEVGSHHPADMADKVKQSGRMSRTHSSPLSSSPAASPYPVSSPNSPTLAAAAVATAAAAAAETTNTTTNLTLAASVTVLNVRTGAPLNATALSNLTPTVPNAAVPMIPSGIDSGEQVGYFCSIFKNICFCLFVYHMTET